MKNIILIGMPGAGKSTVGVLLAKLLCRDFFDTDLVIQSQHGDSLQGLINRYGDKRFLEFEEEALLSIEETGAVVATGGSAVYSEKGMAHLKNTGTVVYIKASYRTLKRRIRNMKTRGIVLAPGETLLDLYRRRCLLYEKYADVTVLSSSCSPENVLQIIAENLK